MIYILSFLFILCCLIVAIKIIDQFKDGFDWFSGALYFIIFLVTCGLVCDDLWALLCHCQLSIPF